MGVLVGRHVVIGELVRNNRWLVAFFLYGLASILWSDFPFIAFKRWIKTLGHPVMALIILTDPDPANALRTVMKRCAYLLLPFSVLFIKYFPQYGRGFDAFTGEAVNVGVGLSKNDLGYLCMVFGLFFFWNLLTTRGAKDRRVRQGEVVLSIGFLCMIGWLLKMADSATSFFTLVLGVVAMIVLGLGFVNKRLIGTYVIVGIFVAVGAELSFGVYAEVVGLLGRDATLTDRTEVWADALALQDSPILGLGFESFWLGPRLQTLWAKWWWKPIQAHNGYIETYLSLGAVGVFLLLGLIVSTFRKISNQLLTNFDFARLRLAFLFAIIAFNYTEAAFNGVHLVWTVFYIIALDYPKRGLQGRTSYRTTSPQTSRQKKFGTLFRDEGDSD